jgi:ABC-2 type transport system permease protein
LITSTNTRQMFWGKLLGLGVITIVQYAIWISLGVILYRANPINNRMVSLDMGFLEFLQFLPFILGGYLLFAGLMAGIGALTPPDQNSRAWVLLITLPLILPIYLWSIIVRAPNGALALFMSLFPLTSPVTMTMRMTTTMVSPWQILVSALLLIATGIATVQFMARIFRETTLLSGEQLSLRRWTPVFLRKD